MEFIQVAYCVTVPFLFLLTWIGAQSSRHFFVNTIAVSNILLIGYSIFLFQQLLGYYHLAKALHIDYMKLAHGMGSIIIRSTLIIVLPFLSLIRVVQKSRLFCLILLALLYWNSPVFTWNTYDLFAKIAGYFCLLCSGYALLWLLNKLPYQSPVV
ncbi:MAG: hypothetical protein JWQ30_1160 [Sediminibacterium sp.]|nr:hypothetical protein [Sediminibacterium sp.]